MKLKDLKQGMVCILRTKENITVLDSGRYFINGLIISTVEEKYNEDLTHKRSKHLDIMEVSFGDKVVFERKESRWFVPEDGERYYLLESDGEVILMTNDRSEVDYDLFNNQRVFKTKEEAEKRLRQQQATLSIEKWIAENDVEVDVNDSDVLKCSVFYDVEAEEFGVGNYYRIIIPKQFILSSEEKAKQLIKEREKELKIMFGVEEE